MFTRLEFLLTNNFEQISLAKIFFPRPSGPDIIIPCGIFDRGVTSISEILGKLIDMNQIKMIITEKFNNNFKKDIL